MSLGNCEQKTASFVESLRSNGFIVVEKRISPHILLINGKAVNIRCRNLPTLYSDGSRLFWYDVGKNVLKSVNFVIFIMTDPSYFVMIPVSFLFNLLSKMYPNNAHPDREVFTIDWDNLSLVLRKGTTVDIYKYAYSLQEDLDKLKEILQSG